MVPFAGGEVAAAHGRGFRTRKLVGSDRQAAGDVAMYAKCERCCEKCEAGNGEQRLDRLEVLEGTSEPEEQHDELLHAGHPTAKYETSPPPRVRRPARPRPRGAT